MNDLFPGWLDALEKRHFASLTFQEVRRSVQSLSSIYVERRTRLGKGVALDGAGKRAAFASYFSPLHFLLVREIVRALHSGKHAVSQIIDFGCGTGVAGAAWALEMNPSPRIVGIEQSAWATREAKWNFGALHLKATFQNVEIDSFRIPVGAGVVAAFAINELSEAARLHALLKFLAAGRHGSPILVVEPIARRIAPWWPEWVEKFTACGGIENEWRFPVDLPEKIELMDRAAGLNHSELTGRSLWLAGKTGN